MPLTTVVLGKRRRALAPRAMVVQPLGTPPLRGGQAIKVRDDGDGIAEPFPACDNAAIRHPKFLYPLVLPDPMISYRFSYQAIRARASLLHSEFTAKSVAGTRTLQHATPMLIQRETSAHTAAIRTVTAAAFTRCAEATLVDELRASDAWLPALSLVAVDSASVIGHVLCSRAWVDSAPVVALGPLSVHPDHQRRGVGQALMHAVLGAADALDEPLVVLLGDPRYYSRFGFRLAEEYGVIPPVPEWRPHFQARVLAAFAPVLHGQFTYAEPFNRVED